MQHLLEKREKQQCRQLQSSLRYRHQSSVVFFLSVQYFGSCFYLIEKIKLIKDINNQLPSHWIKRYFEQRVYVFFTNVETKIIIKFACIKSVS